jgi:hypothetical protein
MQILIDAAQYLTIFNLLLNLLMCQLYSLFIRCLSIKNLKLLYKFVLFYFFIFLTKRSNDVTLKIDLFTNMSRFKGLVTNHCKHIGICTVLRYEGGEGGVKNPEKLRTYYVHAPSSNFIILKVY